MPHSLSSEAVSPPCDAQAYRPRPQIPPEAYGDDYLHHGRILNYTEQLLRVVELKPSSVLEIGIGPGFMRHVALRYLPARWVTCDIDPRLKPDVVGSVTDLPFAERSFDLVICCQVLEHLPFALFGPCLEQLARVTNRHVFLSLPDIRRFYSVSLCLPKVGWVRKDFSIERLRNSAIPVSGEHYWEIGRRGTCWRHVLQQIRRSLLMLCKSERIPEFPYHCCLLLKHRARPHHAE